MNSEPVVSLRSVSKGYPAPAGGGSVEVLEKVNLEIPTGAAIAILGPSGSGKSTLLNLMGGLDIPDEGSVFLAGRNLAGMSSSERSRMRSSEIGFVFQQHHLLPQCTALENVLIPTLARSSRSSNGEVSRGKDLLARVGLSNRMDHRPVELSGGECLRVAVARSLIQNPRLLLADEPTGSLDERATAGLTELLLELNKVEGTSLVVVTHSLELAGSLSTVYSLRGGTIHPESTG